MNNPFYHASTSKYIAAFGAIFNDITLVRYNKAKTAELKRSKVPIVWGPREKYLIRNNEDPELDKKIQMTYPMMSYNLVGWSYAPQRKTNSMIQLSKSPYVGGESDTVYNGVPWDLEFELSIIARNKDDAYQIIEQILPIFNPNFTFTQILIPDIGIVKDIPLVLNSLSEQTDYESDFDVIKEVTITLAFTMSVFFYGPVQKTKIIRKVFANTFLDPSLYTGGAIVRINTSNGNNGVYQTEDIVYQGIDLNNATAAGQVVNWTANGHLTIGGVQGQFKTNNVIKAMNSNAAYILESFDVSPLKIQSIQIEPNPVTANVGDPYGYTETDHEYPNLP